MGSYIAGRLAQALVVFFGVTFVIFAAVWVLPGDPILGLAGGGEISQSTINALRERYNLDDPLLVQYWAYLSGLVTGDLGIDFQGRPISAQLEQRWPVTIQLALTAWIVQAVVGVVLGLIAALRHKRSTDYFLLVTSMLLISIPAFVLAFLMQLVFGVRLGWLPAAGISDGWPLSYILPATVLAAFGVATVMRLVRTSVLTSLQADYTRTAYAKGVSNRRVLIHHVLRNSMIPAVTLLGIELGYLLSGAVIVEGIFNLPGVGQLLFQATIRQDGLVVVSVASVLVLVFVLANFIVDLLYGVLDPRVSHA